MSLMSDYREELKNKETLRLREIQRELPSFVQAFFRGIAQTTSTKTRLAYAYDLRIFFRYLYEEHRTVSTSTAKRQIVAFIFRRIIAPSAASSRRI